VEAREKDRVISCKEASRLISQLQDRELSLREATLMRFHLVWCEACRRFERQMRFLRKAMERYRI